MMDFRSFGGIVPRVHPSDLAPGMATTAHDVNLRHGTLKAWREPLAVHDVPATTQTVYQWGCCWFAWDKCVEVAEWKAGCPRLFVTGDQPYPTVYAMNPDCTTGCGGRQWTRMGVPPPTAAPVASPTQALTAYVQADGSANTITRESRAYGYTYTNCLGEEGPMSYPGNEITVDDGGMVTVSGFAVPPAEWGIVTVTLYRRTSGFRAGLGMVQDHVTDFLRVDEFPVGQGAYIDTMRNLELGAVCHTREHTPPPAGLRNIIAVPDSTILVGSIGNVLCFSAPNQPGNWPYADRYTLDDNITALMVMDGTVLVSTDGHPYIVAAQSNGERAPRAVDRDAYAYPMVTCCSSRGAISTPLGGFYVSSRGLVWLVRGRPAQLATAPWFAPDDWATLRPETMRLGWYDGMLVIVSDTQAFALMIDNKEFFDPDRARLSTLSDRPRSMVSSRSGELFMLSEGVVSQWGAGTALRPFKWQRTTVETQQFAHFSAGRVWVDGSVRCQVGASHPPRIVFDRTVGGTNSFRLPHYGHHLMHSVTFEGVDTVWGVRFATNRNDLTRWK